MTELWAEILNLHLPDQDFVNLCFNFYLTLTNIIDRFMNKLEVIINVQWGKDRTIIVIIVAHAG